MAEVTINYKDAAIATMDASGTKTLQTQGKYCEDDIEVVYARPSAPSGTKQISITQNGTTTEDVAAYANAEITVNVQGGGGGYSADDIALGTPISGAINLTLSGNDKIRQYAFANTGITSVSAPTLVRASGNYCFSDCTSLTTVNLPLFAESDSRYGGNLFTRCTALVNVNAPLIRPGAGQFDGCTALKTYVNTTAYNQGIGSYAFRNCSNLEALDLNSVTQFSAVYAWGGTAKLAVIVLRRTDAIIPCSSASNVPDSMKSGGIGCTVFVPSALKSQYEQATNWSTLVADGKLTFAAIEGSIYENAYADGTPIT